MQRAILIVAFTLILPGSSARVHAQLPSDFSPLPPEVEEAIYCRACGLFNRDALPPGSPYIPDRAICGTPVLVELASNWHRLSKRTKEAFSTLFLRPGATHSVVSPEGRFKIHYNISGRHRVDPTDEDKNGTPDFVDEAARTFDSAWELQIDQLGYNPPLSDGDELYDVYLRDLSDQNVYAFTYPETRSSVTHSYMEIDNNFTDSIYRTRGLDGLHVTAAHELFHAVQFGYYADYDSAWWQELTATWMEEVAYNDVNDYYQYLTCARSFSCIFDSPQLALDNFVPFFSLRPFGASVFALHLEQVYGRASIRRSWEVLKERRPSSFSLADIDVGLPMGGFAGVIPRFFVWNYLTATRSRPGYYPEASRYPSILRATASPPPGGSVLGSGRVDHLGTAYIRVPTARLSGGVRGEFTLDSKATWRLLVLLVTDWGGELLWPDETTVEIPDAGRYQEVVFIPMVVSLEDERFDYEYTISVGTEISQASDRVGDFTGDVRVNFADFIAFSGGFNQKPSAAGYNQRLDLNGDGRIDFQDFLIFVSHFGE